MIRLPTRSTHGRSSAASDVTKRQLGDTPRHHQLTSRVTFCNTPNYQDCLIDRAGGARIHICLLYKLKIRNNLFGKQNVSFEKRAHAGQCTNGGLSGTGSPAEFKSNLILARCFRDTAQIIKSVFRNTALILGWCFETLP